jgi:response regulator RpfG family c-di-GMP phosphodiesterase
MGVQDKEKEFKAHILCVDDERNILMAIRRTLRSTGHTIHLAESGKEGLAILAAEPIDLVISDMRMPEMDGAEFLKQVHQKYPLVGRVLLTGFSDLTSTIKAVNEGRINNYLSKPWDDDELRRVVQELLHTRFLEHERKRLLHITHQQNKKLVALTRTLEDKVKERTAELEQTAAMLDEAYREVSVSYDAAVSVLSNVVMSRRGSLQSALSDISLTVKNLAQRIHNDEFFLKHVHYASLLFEIGKQSMSDELLNTPIDHLTNEQKKVYVNYPVVGEASLMSMPILSDTAKIIRSHCENFDGTGFPDKLIGNAIPLGARILAIVINFYYFRHGLIDGKTHSAAEAIEYLDKLAFKKFDPEILEVFKQLVTELKFDENQPQDKRLTSMQLLPGMRLAKDCVTDKGVLLLTRGTQLTEGIIDKLLEFEKLHNSTITFFIEK